ncbi:hypothetical protein FKP32DRAFT_1531238, partial [Trametes sanguinea]
SLRTHVQDPVALRSVLRLLHAVISGSFALAFLTTNCGPSFSPRDLDIYVPRGYARRMANYLSTHEGYSRLLYQTQRYGDNPAMHSIHYLGNGQQRVDIIESSNHSALSPLPNFWASHVINYLSADSYCISYPTFTLRHHALLSAIQLVQLRYPSPKTTDLMHKYSARGYTFSLAP